MAKFSAWIGRLPKGIPMKQLTLAATAALLAVNLQADILTGLVAYYPFDGDTLDASGNGLHATPHTGVVSYADGQFGRAAWFDGAMSLQIPSPRLLDGASSASISAWIWFDTSIGGQVIGAGDGRPGRDPITTRINPSGAEDFRFEQVIADEQTLIGFEYAETFSGLSVGAWHQLTWVLDSLGEGSVFRCYVDTALVKEDANPLFQSIAYDADMPALIGAIEALSPYQFWRGRIDDLRIYGRALDVDDIAELAMIPEPTALALLALGSLAFVMARRRL
jgi:hypothetical protein